MNQRILSFDVATKTGWSFIDLDTIKLIHGLIETSSKFSRAKKLSYFRGKVKELLLKLKPTHIVMESVFAGLNPKTLVLLAKFGGVLEECCMSISNIEPYIIHTNTVKSYFKVKTKEELFNFVIDIIEWKNANFNKDNDIIDSIAQLLCYCDKVLEFRKFKKETDYGFVYKV